VFELENQSGGKSQEYARCDHSNKTRSFWPVAICARMNEMHDAAWDTMRLNEEWPAKLNQVTDDRSDETIVKDFAATLTGSTPQKRAAAIARLVKRGNYTELRAVLVYSAIQMAKHEPYGAINLLALTRRSHQLTCHLPPTRAVGWDRFTAKVLFSNPNAEQRGVEALTAAGYDFKYRHDVIDACGPTVFGTVIGRTELDEDGLGAWLAGIIYSYDGMVDEWGRDEDIKQRTLGSDAFETRYLH
jgi:hypothetical protein